MDFVRDLQNLFGEVELEEDGGFSLPDWGITIHPHIKELQENKPVELNIRISSPVWDRELFECSVGIGETAKAVRMAWGSFALCMMDGIKEMMRDQGYACGACTCKSQTGHLTSQFAGIQHQWRVYESALVYLGVQPEEAKMSYWEIIADEVKKRLGNQKMCYVKIYTAKFGDNLTIECRINNVLSPQINEIIAEYVDTWQAEGFVSQKQFFFLVQEEATYTPYPYMAGDISDYVIQAITLLDNGKTVEDYKQYSDILAQQIGDKDLAREITAFLPEMCAESLFENFDCGETILFDHKGEQLSVYKTQIASYYPIMDALYAEFAEGTVSKEVYEKFISVSAMYDAICQAKEQGEDLTQGGKFLASLSMDDDYRLR